MLLSRRNLLEAGALGVATVAGCSEAGRYRPPLPTATPADEPTGDQNWPQYRFDSRNSGYQPDATVPREDVDVLWKYSTDFHRRSSPIVVDGAVFIASRVWDHIALNARTGELIWRHEAGPQAQDTTGVRVGDKLFIGLGAFYELEASTGEELRRYDLPTVEPSNFVHGPAKLAHGRLFFSTRYNMVSLDLESRSVDWFYGRGNPIGSTPAVDESNVYATSGEGVLLALDPVTGDLRWKTSPERQLEVGGIPAVGDDLVYVTGDREELIAIETDTGDVRWALPYEDSGEAIPAVTESALFVTRGADRGHLAALDPYTGETLWTHAEGGYLYEEIVATPDTLVGMKGGRLTAHDATTGEKLWGVMTGHAHSTPCIADETVYVGGRDGVYAVSERG